MTSSAERECFSDLVPVERTLESEIDKVAAHQHIQSD